MPTNVIMPKIAESIFDGTLTRWLKKEGDWVEKDENLFEISTDKVDTVIPSPASGRLEKVTVKEGETVPVNTVLAILVESPGEPSRVEATPAQTVPLPPPPAAAREGQAPVSPLVRKMAQQHGIDLARVTGSGPGGRITKEDIEKLIEKKETPPSKTGVVEIDVPPAPPEKTVSFASVVTGPVETVPMTPMRKKIAEHMVASRRISAHVATVWEVDLTKVVAIREKEKEYYEIVHGIRLTLTPFFAAAAIEAIKEFPVLNASVEGDKIIYKKYVNLGVAVALPEGLIVPVVRGADEKSFLGLCRGIQDVAERARNKKLTPDDVQGGTFTITNPGVFGGLFGIPIINQPQVAILGVGGVQKRPVVVEDAIAIRTMVYLSLSFDHRIIDGAVADQFMGRVKSVLQNWRIPVK